jgi:hypothetical protein
MEELIEWVLFFITHFFIYAWKDSMFIEEFRDCE